ncbi:ABC transporter permease [Beijerinckia indica]|uniref:Binding-protein-dependent transport systems inner membrane component n=1 Tax=Beijerinckia indica subsp. indica (strain ATCC 9039 / DSM 1715 / NCIMB 8712) TaxID=395963 RepID=B2IF13_BEII9|nr:ABC transporter permease [Beijerinckia indica]ACB94204.1 binding-protein-dependent transport systems inner membrane component [Beijerinckia indica subsp. indica ATCC 9039]
MTDLQIAHPVGRQSVRTRTKETVPFRSVVNGIGRRLNGKILLGLLLPGALLALWAILARLGTLPEQILPAPSLVIETFQDYWASGELWQHCSYSLWRIAAGFSVGASLGLILGIAMGLSPVVEDIVSPFFLAFAQVPAIGWVPLLMLVAGIGETLKILVIAKAALVPVAVNTQRGLHNVPKSYLEVGRVLTFDLKPMLRHIILPAAVPDIFSGIRYGLTNAWLALVAVELIASAEGLGYLTVWGRQLFQLDVVIMAMIVIGTIGFLLDRGLQLIESHLLSWRTLSR